MLAALLVHHSLGRRTAPVVMSYSWDRYVMDPVPGPRSVGDYQGLRPLTERSWRVTGESRVRWAATPTLPLLARLTGAQVVLLDPHQGAVAMSQTMAEALREFAAREVTLVDVGGDVIAEGHESQLMSSPLGDSLALAALAKVGVCVSVVVAGPGLDGELPASRVAARCDEIASDSLQVTPEAVQTCGGILREHPSEATALLAAAALGIRAEVEIRDSGALVSVTDTSAAAYVIPYERALKVNRLAQRLVDTTSLAEAEQITTDVCGRCELTYERRKALSKGDARVPTPSQLIQAVADYRQAAILRGASHGTLRRLCEVVGLDRYRPAALRQLVGNAHPLLPIYSL